MVGGTIPHRAGGRLALAVALVVLTTGGTP